MVGYDRGSKKMDAETLAKYIHGGHVEEYMETMEEEEPEKYQAHFAKYIDAGVEPGEMEDLYKEASEVCARERVGVCYGCLGSCLQIISLLDGVMFLRR
jgi:large subunit ribosomal protein L5e